MSIVQTQPWEVRLLHVAQEAFNTQPCRDAIRTQTSELEAAYATCEALTRFHSRTFYVASGLLPKEERQAVRALYAFCRVTDDIVDTPQESLSARLCSLQQWQDVVMGDGVALGTELAVSLAWADAQATYNIPRGYAQQLIDGCARDIRQQRYATFDDLAEYSYGVASTVGLMAMHIIGFSSPDALPYAIRLGVALQLTNILRDVGEDWRNGRVYLPQDDLARFGLSDADIEAGIVTPAWRAFMRYQIERNRRLYAEGLPGIAYLSSQGRFAITAAARLYEGILYDIEANDYNVFYRRARVSTLGKVRKLPSIWWQSRRAAL